MHHRRRALQLPEGDQISVDGCKLSTNKQKKLPDGFKTQRLSPRNYKKYGRSVRSAAVLTDPWLPAKYVYSFHKIISILFQRIIHNSVNIKKKHL
jgi:hypothetical protein